MMMPRCGVPDIVNGRTRMNSAGKYNLDYAFYDGQPKWPLSKKVLNWGLLAGTRRDIIDPVSNYALLSWTGVTPFKFNFVDENVRGGDIAIGFVNKSSVLSEGALGFAFPPTFGTVYFNGNVNWSDGTAAPGTYDMGTAALHELGHALGLQHSSVEAAIMWPTLGSGVIKGLHDDDYQGMKALYGT
ncbi:unnamed protein product [Dovyalis caffra]|uniref:Peptidase metallopeptidase domain-containing protein n=1 Tax=Dovyalis caffra TaxID=77055 RepID=A0AAV1RL62_9ROSI|nr:unnamed protein product [Dovyalis caffra]